MPLVSKSRLVMPRYTRWASHGVVRCVSLSSSFPARPSPVAFLVRPPAPTLCSSRSPPPTVAPSLRRSNHHVIQIWQARNSNLAGDDYRSGSPRRGRQRSRPSHQHVAVSYCVAAARGEDLGDGCLSLPSLRIEMHRVCNFHLCELYS